MIMTNLGAKYMGFTLKSPIIISSCGLTDNVDRICRFEELGAGAVVLKSLFEEQINYDAGKYVQNGIYPEAHDYITGYAKNNSVEEYLRLIESAKKAVSIPVMASINCFSINEWVSFAKEIEKAGADALELNVFFVASDKDKSSEKLENLYSDLLVKVKSVTRLPLAVKIGYHFTNLTSMVNSLYLRGAKGVVLFNRFYEPDIDLENMRLTTSGVFSNPSDMRQSLRWVGIISDRVQQIDIAASTGIHDGKAVIKQILAGAKAVQICSVIYRKGEEQVRIMLDELERWMKEKDYNALDDFRGRLNCKNIPDPSVYERSQFMKYFSGYH
jgi:dihydroorotate dehydrogenase (fumarate)